jgi:3-dehydroquinate dehydratase type I
MICASIKEKKMAHLFKRLKSLPPDYEIVEIWVNEIDDFDLSLLFKWRGRRKFPFFLIKFTDFKGLGENLNIIQSSVDFIDIDYKKFIEIFDFSTSLKHFKKMLHKKTRLILSYHDFKKTPNFIKAERILSNIEKAGADIAKLIFTAKSYEDNLIPLKLYKKCNIELISFCMGEKGKISRVLAPDLGCKINFVPPNEKWKTAKGQIILKEWKKINR